MAASKKSTRSSRPPRRPLDDEYRWDTLDSLSADVAKISTDLAQFARFPSPTLPAHTHTAPLANIPPSASPPQQTTENSASPPLARDTVFVASSDPKNRVQTAFHEPPQDKEYRRLLLAKETQQLEVQKLQLQLELTKLQASTGSVVPESSSPASARLHDHTKSLGDLRAPQHMLFPQQWLHIFAPGEPKLYNELSLAEFTAGYLAIVEKCPDAPQKSLFLHHLADLMSLACSYQWSAVRAFHYKVLRALEMGLVRWGDSFDGFKQPFFISPNLLPSFGLTSQDKTRKTNPSRPPAPQQPLRHQICDDWSWHDDCHSEDCPKLHICIICKRPDHQAKNCSKRKFDIPPRRQDLSTKSS